jgi:hypothetical protein
VVKKAHVPPAKKRYDEKHPTVSFRVSREGYDRLKETLNKQGKTIGQFFREALEIEERNYKEAYWRGFREARERYAIYTICLSCYEPIAIDNEELKEEITARVEQICLHHGCPLPDGVTESDVIRFKRRKGKKVSKSHV